MAVSGLLNGHVIVIINGMKLDQVFLLSMFRRRGLLVMFPRALTRLVVVSGWRESQDKRQIRSRPRVRFSVWCRLLRRNLSGFFGR